MAKSYYSVAFAFYEAKPKEETDKYTEEECLQALRFLTLDSSFIVKPLTKGAFQVKYESGRTVCLLSARQTLRFIAVNHAASQAWYTQANHRVVQDIAAKLVALAADQGKAILDEIDYLDEAARRLCGWYFSKPETQAMLKTHFELAVA